MPQGSWLCPLSFIVLIDDLMAGPIHTNMLMTAPFLNLCPLFLKRATLIHLSSVCFLGLPKTP